MVSSDFSVQQSKDPETRRITTYLEEGLLPDNLQLARRTATEAMSFCLIDKILYYIDLSQPNVKRTVVRLHMRETVLADTHGGVMAGYFSGP